MSHSRTLDLQLPNPAALYFSSSCGEASHKVSLLLLYNYNFAAALNCNVNIWYVIPVGVTKHGLKTAALEGGWGHHCLSACACVCVMRCGTVRGWTGRGIESGV